MPFFRISNRRDAHEPDVHACFAETTTDDADLTRRVVVPADQQGARGHKRGPEAAQPRNERRVSRYEAGNDLVGKVVFACPRVGSRGAGGRGRAGVSTCSQRHGAGVTFLLDVVAGPGLVDADAALAGEDLGIDEVDVETFG
jgi:hypothetical protein